MSLKSFRIDFSLGLHIINWLSGVGSSTSTKDKAAPKGKEAPKTFPYAKLPRSLQLSVIKWLSFEDICRAAPACKALLSLTQNEDFLRGLYKREFPRRNQLDKITYQEFFKRVKQEARAQRSYGHCFPIVEKEVDGLSSAKQSPVTGNLLLCSSGDDRSSIQVCDLTFKNMGKFSVGTKIRCMAISFITGNVVLASDDCLFLFTEQGSGLRRNKAFAKLCYMVSSPVEDIFAGHDSIRRNIHVFDASLQQRHVLSSPEVDFTCLAISPTTGHLVTGSKDKTVCIWDMAKGSLLKQFSSLGVPISMQFCDGQLAVSMTSCPNSRQDEDGYFSLRGNNQISFFDDQGKILNEQRHFPAIFEDECRVDELAPQNVTIDAYPFTSTLLASCVPGDTYLMLSKEKGGSENWFKLDWPYEFFLPIPGTHCVFAAYFDQWVGNGKIALLEFTYPKETVGKPANSSQDNLTSTHMDEELSQHLDIAGTNYSQVVLCGEESTRSIQSSLRALKEVIPKQ